MLLFISLAATLMALLLVEILSRRFLPDPYDVFIEKGLTQDSTPYVMFTAYRTPPPPSNKQPHEFRIFMLGGSALYMGDPPIPTLLQQKFQEQGCGNVTVHNFGVPSQGSGQELARIVFEILDLAPDLIVAYNGENDISHPLTVDPRPGYPYNFLVYENNPLLNHDVTDYPGIALLAYSSNVLRHLVSQYFVRQFVPLEELRAQVDYGSEGWRNSIAQTYVTNMLKSHKIAKAFGAEFIAFFQPAIAYKDVLSSGEQGRSEFIGRREHGLAVRERVLAHAEVAKQGTGFTLVDMSDIFDDVSDDVFLDAVHIRQQYKPMIANKIYQYLADSFSICH